MTSAILNLPQPANWEEPQCYFNDVRAYWFTAIKPRNAVDLAYMCGVEVSELPDLLQHWHNRDDEPYTGNQILNRIDPLEWAIHPPWERESFMVKIFLSKRARTRLIRELEPPAPVTTGEEEGVPMVIRM